MGIVNRDKNPEFIAAGDDFLNDYISEINQPKQLYEQPEIEDDDIVDEVEITGTLKEPSQYAQKRGKEAARWSVETLDKIISSMVAVYANSDDVDEFRADDDDISDLSEQLSSYFIENNVGIPHYIFALITAAFIIKKKFNGVGAMRAVNLERRKYKIESEKLQIQVNLLTEKNRMLELQRKVADMESKTA